MITILRIIDSNHSNRSMQECWDKVLGVSRTVSSMTETVNKLAHFIAFFVDHSESIVVSEPLNIGKTGAIDFKLCFTCRQQDDPQCSLINDQCSISGFFQDQLRSHSTPEKNSVKLVPNSLN
ncbi:hypothetical protein PoB_002287900 [Plakobranchus ocellatus]|uniref:Uncharacterized protein n=1 Tax=Plakobranchus ocellatus TaxID=259542 RepID=A0AAV3ZM24_9GAST|nr:hypothetical protein PoB_002287900 [Plakobranchus ocellatus]